MRSSVSTTIAYSTKQITKQIDLKLVDLVKNSFTKIAPFWPLQNLIAVNPLQGFEDLPIEEAMQNGTTYFEQPDLPAEMLLINIQTIKWLATYCDEGQAIISMPYREQGLYNAWRKIAQHDTKLHNNKIEDIKFLKNLPEKPEQVIAECFIKLGINKNQQQEFLTLLLTTLPGWAAFIKYKSEYCLENIQCYNITQLDYIAVRIIITTLIWKKAKNLLNWHKIAAKTSENNTLQRIQTQEDLYRNSLLTKIMTTQNKIDQTPDAQLVFCIDVRSEPFRRNIESIGNYETFGFAGFFGVPVEIKDKITGNSYPSCPVLIQPKHKICYAPSCSKQFMRYKNKYNIKQSIKRVYQSLKYSFATPFALVESLGFLCGILMIFRNILPKFANKGFAIRAHNIVHQHDLDPTLDNISLQEKYNYAENALKIIGLTSNFAPIVVFCGHGSTTCNNAYATALDCGACGGRHGGNNAKILAAILNYAEVRILLRKNGINIPENTYFIAAEHNTTTDDVILFCKRNTLELQKLKQDLLQAKEKNNFTRSIKLGLHNNHVNKLHARAYDWAEVRPEWGLARNAAFIIAPRSITASIDLEGRCFLHSYNYKQDPQGTFLTNILTAPMIVATWINMQYFFSTINNIAYGAGSKVTKNIVGKLGIMQGNSSDIMNGLPLQSLYLNDKESYHDPLRLMVVVLAPRNMLSTIISNQLILQKLFGNGWIQMAVLDPIDNKTYLLGRDFLWQQMN